MSRPTSRSRARLLYQALWEGCDTFSKYVADSRRFSVMMQAMAVERGLSHEGSEPMSLEKKGGVHQPYSGGHVWARGPPFGP